MRKRLAAFTVVLGSVIIVISGRGTKESIQYSGTRETAEPTIFYDNHLRHIEYAKSHEAKGNFGMAAMYYEDAGDGSDFSSLKAECYAKAAAIRAGMGSYHELNLSALLLVKAEKALERAEIVGGMEAPRNAAVSIVSDTKSVIENNLIFRVSGSTPTPTPRSQ